MSKIRGCLFLRRKCFKSVTCCKCVGWVGMGFDIVSTNCRSLSSAIMGWCLKNSILRTRLWSVLSTRALSDKYTKMPDMLPCLPHISIFRVLHNWNIRPGLATQILYFSGKYQRWSYLWAGFPRVAGSKHTLTYTLARRDLFL